MKVIKNKKERNMKAIKNIVIKSKEQYQENIKTLKELESVFYNKKVDQIERAVSIGDRKSVV